MTSEEIRAAIERLRKISYGARKYNALEAVEAVISDGSWVDGLTDLLKQADPDTHTEFPVDVDGVPIHVDDVMYDCNESPSESFRVAAMELCKWGWTLIDAFGERSEPSQCRHYNKPTVEELLFEFGKICQDGYDIGNNIHEYAAKLREVMADE